MLVVAIQNEFINQTISLVNAYFFRKSDWSLAPKKFIAYKALKMCWVNCVKPRIGLSNVACIIISWVRVSCRCLKIIFW